MIRRLAVLVAAILAIGAVVGGERIAVEEPESTPALVADVTPAAQPIACPGPVEIPVGDIDSGDPDLGSGSSERSYDVEGDTEPVGAGFLASGDTAASLERIGSGDVAGLSAASCTAPSREQWLVGGSTALSASARLVLTNPSDASTEATVTFYGPIGELEERAVVSIAPGGQQDLLLEGVVAEVPALVARVVATGAGVVAHVQDSRLDGFQPAGTDWVGRGAAPGTRLVVPGVGVGDAGDATLRLMAPDGATVELTLAGDAGLVDWGGVAAVELEPGVVTEVAIPPIASGAVEIRADAPVVAAAMLRIARDVVDGPADAQAYDLAWVPAQDVSDGKPRSVRATDRVTAVTVHAAAAGTFALTADGATVASVDMDARTTATVAIDVEPGMELTGSSGFAWRLTLADAPGFIASLEPRRTDIEPLEVVVGQRAYVGAGQPLP